MGIAIRSIEIAIPNLFCIFRVPIKLNGYRKRKAGKERARRPRNAGGAYYANLSERVRLYGGTEEIESEQEARGKTQPGRMAPEKGEIDRSNDISDKYAVHSIPTKFLIDREGKIVDRIDEGQDAKLDQLLDEIFK